MIDQKKIGIIGINGRYGQWLRRFFGRQGQQVVIGSDTTTSLNNQIVVERSDVVIFAVPLSATVAVIEEVIPFSRPEQLWIDVSSLKGPTVNAMMRSRAEVLGLHPLFAPPKEETWERGAVVTHHARVNKWQRWAYEFLQATGARLIEVAPLTHDRVMLGIQNLPHILTLAYATAIHELGILPSDLTDLSTPVSQRIKEMLDRMLGQSPDVYIGIQFENPESMRAIDALLRALVDLRVMIERKNRDGLARIFADLADRFDEGSHVTSEE